MPEFVFVPDYTIEAETDGEAFKKFIDAIEYLPTGYLYFIQSSAANPGYEALKIHDGIDPEGQVST